MIRSAIRLGLRWQYLLTWCCVPQERWPDILEMLWSVAPRGRIEQDRGGYLGPEHVHTCRNEITLVMMCG